MTNYFTVPGAQVTPAERQRIHDLAAEYNRADAIIVNIGIMWGCTLWCLRAGAPLAQLYGVDIAPDNWPIWEHENLRAAIIQADSRNMDFAPQIDVLLIDGDHHYAAVAADIDNWLGRVRAGGVVIFHDYTPTAENLHQFPELEGVQRAVDEWQAEAQWTALPAPDSLAVFKRG